jgi:hypothetical protein
MIRDKLPTGFPTIVTLCGSTRFKDAFAEAGQRETLAGQIVLSIGCNMRTDTEIFGHSSADEQERVKKDLDALHFRKIEMSDEILVLNCKLYRCASCKKWFVKKTEESAFGYGFYQDCDCGSHSEQAPYIGQSTRNEIAYAQSIGVTVRYLNNPQE